MGNRSQVPRIVLIDQKLREGNYPNCRILAEEYEVSEKTIQRDIDHMRDFLMAPIEYDTSRKGFYYTEDNFFLPALDIKESDFFAICIGEKALALYENTPIYEQLAGVFEKIRQLLPESIRVNTSWVDSRYTFMDESRTYIDPEIWELISRSLRYRKQMNIFHAKAGQDDAQKRTVEPLHIVCYRGEWYLIAYCHKREEVLSFAVSRIKKAIVTENPFRYEDNFDYTDYMKSTFGIMRGNELKQIRVRFSAEQAPYILERQWHQNQEITENSDGTVDLSFESSSLFEVKRWILSWGGDAQVLEPEDLALQVRDEAERILKGNLLPHE